MSSHAKKRQDVHPVLHTMQSDDINNAALKLLGTLLDRCSMNLLSDLSGISRTTIYKWLDEDVPLESMSARDSAWFIIMCEHEPRLVKLLSRPPATHKNLVRQGMAQEDAAA
jgi:hypothetical protein